MTTGGVYTITCPQNGTLLLTFQWLNANSSPVNLTGFTALMQVRQTQASPNNIVSLGTSDVVSRQGFISFNAPATDGKININLPNIICQTIPVGTYYYDLLMNSGSAVTRLMEGLFILDPGVSKY